MEWRIATIHSDKMEVAMIAPGVNMKYSKNILALATFLAIRPIFIDFGPKTPGLAPGMKAARGWLGGQHGPLTCPERSSGQLSFVPMYLAWEYIGAVTPSGNVNTI